MEVKRYKENGNHVLEIKSGRNWIFDLEKREQILAMFNPEADIELTRKKLKHTSDFEYGLSDAALEQLFRPFTLVTSVRYGDGIEWINGGKGYSEDEIRDYLDESLTSETGLDDLFGDIAVAPTLMEQMLNDLNKLE